MCGSVSEFKSLTSFSCRHHLHIIISLFSCAYTQLLVIWRCWIRFLTFPLQRNKFPHPFQIVRFRFFSLILFVKEEFLARPMYVEYIFDLNETAMSSLKQVYLNLTWSTDNASFASTLIDRSSSHQSVLLWTELFLSIPSDPFIRIEKLSHLVFNIVESCLLCKWILNSRHRYIFIVITISKPLEVGPEWITGGDRILGRHRSYQSNMNMKVMHLLLIMLSHIWGWSNC